MEETDTDTTSSMLTPRSEDSVFQWRLEELVRAGYPRGTAIEIAESKEADLHFAVDLVAKGCPHSIAAEIVL